eukprot:TRINITY_DN3516_c0_g1_i3.p1 TRINITY_DN3516_c0_g1~~TRINITY_DN3516_c0_g1_i3.p1  ORF type:complete len:187 (+),score=57.24 TRINITY_DN3516_c0_g1_i3:172-732(+)
MCIRDRRKYNLNVPVHMMVILMLFNTEDSLTYQQIANATRINKHELDRALITLSMHKIRVLTTTLTKLNKNMKPDDVFSFNTGFSATHSKLKIQASKSSSGERDPHSTRSAIIEDRKHEVDAAVVRIMKARGELPHNQLLSLIHISEPTRLLSISYAVFCLKKKKKQKSQILKSPNYLIRRTIDTV